MKQFENERNQSIDNIIFLSQVLFFLTLGVLILRSSHFSYDNLLNSGQFILFSIFMAFIPFIRLLNSKFQGKTLVLDFFVIFIYLFTVSYYLVVENDNLFKVALLMPVLTTALRYGRKVAFISAVLSSAALFIVSVINVTPSLDADIMFSGVLFLLAWLLGNMTETERSIREELERLANNDGLTDIYNHRSFQNLLDEELSKAKDENSSVSLILLDIDYFKVYNDSFGHQKGDKVLIEVANILKVNTQGLGHCARYGGEEFAVILPKNDIRQAKLCAEKIRINIEKTNFTGMEVLPGGRLTVSIGIAQYPLMADNKEKLIQKADEALYKAKFVSKNKVEAYYSVFDDLSAALEGQERELFNSIRALTMVINAKDKYTYGHSERTMEMSKKLAQRLGLAGQDLKDIIYGALLHDIGKIEISREILNKPNMLNDSEWEIFKQHPEWGADIIRPLTSFQGAVEIIRNHHENLDGTGYPQGLQGEQIPLGARILRIVDSYDAMTTNRPYREALSEEQAREELQRYAGTHYDLFILDEFIKILNNEQPLKR